MPPFRAQLARNLFVGLSTTAVSAAHADAGVQVGARGGIQLQDEALVGAFAQVLGRRVARRHSRARWSRQVDARVEKIRLESGALSIHVDHVASASGRRLLVLLPDGELEDIGTTFSVSADAGHTTRVTVQDGSVVLRIHGSPPLVLGAGESWSPAASPAATLLEPTPPPTSRRRSAKAKPSAMPASEPNPLDADPSADFRAAMSAFNSGDHTRAAASFAAFLRKHPSDRRAEDAAYLHILAHQRAGNSAAMKQAAHDYLSRYPRGFRRAEVERLLP